jgi:hypothetical protein
VSTYSITPTLTPTPTPTPDPIVSSSTVTSSTWSPPASSYIFAFLVSPSHS